MKEFRVSWVVYVSAESAGEAAVEARKIQRDRNSLATVFNVEDVEAGFVYIVDVEITEEYVSGTLD